MDILNPPKDVKLPFCKLFFSMKQTQDEADSGALHFIRVVSVCCCLLYAWVNEKALHFL